ncbi:MAG: WbqC family protein [Candidatus Gracilibacteria bacterium]
MITIHQPETYPWLGFFNKMMLADEYIILDDVQFRKNYFQNRNQFLTKQGSLYLSVPVDFKKYKIIKDIRIRYNEKWQLKHLNTIKQTYGKSKYFSEHIAFFEDLYSKNFELLIDFNMYIIEYIRKVLDIQVPIIRSSSLNCDGASGELLLNICKDRDATTYISGRDGRNYLDVTIFEKKNIDVVYHDFTHPKYEQFYSKEFVPFMNTFDLLLNYSTQESKKIILSGGTFCEKGL